MPRDLVSVAPNPARRPRRSTRRLGRAAASLLPGGALILVAGAALAQQPARLVPSVKAPHTIDPRADSTGPVVVDSAGNGYLAWDHSIPHSGSSDSVVFCKVPKGGTCTHPLTLPLPRHASWGSYYILQPFPVLGGTSGVVSIVAPSYVLIDTVVWTSRNHGSSFSPLQVVPRPSFSGQGAVGDVLRAPFNKVPYPDYFSVSAVNPGLGYSFTGIGAIGALDPPAAFSLQTARIPGAPNNSTLGFSGQETVEAFSTDADTPRVAYFWSPLPGVSGSPGTLEHGPIAVADGTDPRLAGGPKGLYLLSEDDGSTPAKPLQLHVRKWDATTHTFGVPSLVATVPQGVDATDEGGFGEDATTGALYVAWPGTDSAGRDVMDLWISASGGRTFSGPTELATRIGSYSGPARVAVAGGSGLVTWQDGDGLELADVTPHM